MCDGSRSTCALGCDVTGTGASFKSFDPEGSVAPQDLVPALGTGDLVLGNDVEIVVLDTNTGSLVRKAPADAGADSGAVVVLRPANVDPAVEEVAGGYAFRVDGDRAILRAVNITLGERLSFEGSLPLALVASKTLRLEAAVRVPCGQLGGGLPGADTEQTGAPYDTTANNQKAGGGGSNGGAGGDGRYGRTPRPARPRPDGALFGGGAGGNGYSGRLVGGGLGGGSVQLVAGEAIRIGKSAFIDGALVSNGGGGSGRESGEGSRFDGAAAAGGSYFVWDPNVGFVDPVYSGKGGTRGSPQGGDHGGNGTDAFGGRDARFTAAGGGVGFVVLKSADGTVQFAPEAVVSPEPAVGRITLAP